jgi:hypothetical protein
MAEQSRESGGGSRLNDKAWLARIWGDFDVKYMKPFLTHARPTLLETLPVCCNPIARILTTTEQMTQVLTAIHVYCAFPSCSLHLVHEVNALWVIMSISMLVAFWKPFHRSDEIGVRDSQVHTERS